MRFQLTVAIAAAAASMTAPSFAGVQYIPMPPSAPFTRLIGSGGTKITTDGVDFWTTGNPPRAYLVLGVLMDSNDAKMMAAIGSRQLATKVRELGGDALIVVDMAKLPVEAATALKNAPGLTAHQFSIVRYLSDGAHAVAENDTAGQMQKMRNWVDQQCDDAHSRTSPALSRGALDSIRRQLKQITSDIAEATKNAPEDQRRRNAEIQRLTMQMLDCQEQQLVADATNQAVRGGVGTEVSWTSATHPNVAGRSKVTGEERLADGGRCLTVTDVIIIDGEETSVPKRMCRGKDASGYVKA